MHSGIKMSHGTYWYSFVIKPISKQEDIGPFSLACLRTALTQIRQYERNCRSPLYLNESFPILFDTVSVQFVFCFYT